MSPLPRLLALAACGCAGYFATVLRPALSPTAPASADLPQATPAKDSTTTAWRELRARHGSDAGALAALYAEVKDLADPFRRRAFRSTLLAEWAARDPLAALAFLEKNDDGKVSEFLREWLRSDPRAAIDRLLAGGEKGQDTLREMLGDIARGAPALLAEAVSALPKYKGGFNFQTRDAFEIFARNDPAAARAAAESVNGPLRGQALAGVAKLWAERDGPGAIAWEIGRASCRERV